MSHRRLFAAFVLTAALCACRGTGGPAIPGGVREARPAPAVAGAAAAITFTSLGPTHMTSGLIPTAGKTNAYASDPKHPGVIYLASGRGTGLETYSSGGIFRTTNGGASWQPVVTGLTDTSGMIDSVVNSLWMDPSDASTLLAATEYDGIFRTTDRGASWRNVYRSTQATQFVKIGSKLYATAAAGVLVSSDAGATWKVSLSGVQPTALGAASNAPGSVLYAGTTLGAVEFLQANVWHKAGTIPFTAATHTEGSTPAVHQLAVDPREPGTLYASTNDGLWDQDLFVSTDAGKNWKAVLKRPIYRYGLGAQAIAFSAVHPHRLYIGADGAFYYIEGRPNLVAYEAAPISVIDVRDLWVTGAGKDDDCVIASDQGLDRVPNCSTPGQSPQDNVVSSSIAMGLARHFAISPNGTTLFVSLQDFDSHISFDGGSSWAETNYYEDGFNELRPGNPNVCYVLDEAVGLNVSSDGCRTFARGTPAQQAIVPSRLMSAPIAFDPKNPLVMYLLSGPIEAPGIRGQRAVFRSDDGGTTFTKEPWPFVHAGTIVVDGRNGKHIVVSDLRGPGSTLSTTFDGGKTWTRAKGVPASAFWYTASISPVNGNIVLASSVDAATNVYVLRSNDGGRTFVRTQIVTSAPALVGRIDADRHGRLHSRGREAEDETPGNAAAAFLYSPVREIRYNQEHARGVADAVLTTLRGAFLSSDNGSTWTRLDRATTAHSFWGARWRAGYLYLGSDGQGLLRSDAPVQR
ncbi:MAG TPA: hypothetical protein VK760_02095 [Candidatus Acidoferrales bacterium]|jgi:hypothetical protein|nr:hypothetical protein [Candidatus Acidoferrales bacterium]